MKKLAYLALVLLAAVTLGSCVINLNDDYGDNYIRVDWYGSTSPTINYDPEYWYGNNDALIDSSNPATVYQLNTIYESWHKTASGNFSLTYDDYLGNTHTVPYQIPYNSSSIGKYYVLYLDTTMSNGGRLYNDGDEPPLSVGTIK